MPLPLIELGERLIHAGYRFITVTPSTHRLVNARAGNEFARSVRDIFGWNRPFDPDLLPPGWFDLMRAAAACDRIVGTGLWQSTVRFASLDARLYVHSSFPTVEKDAVFFGPDTYRFVRAIVQHASRATRLVDVGCGAGAGGIELALRGLTSAVVLADINTEAIRFARTNAAFAGVEAEFVCSDALQGVPGEVDLIVANPPYIRDEEGRAYRDGGGTHGEQLSVRIARESIARLGQNATGGTLLLYTGSAILNGVDSFLSAVQPALEQANAEYSYEELDPDVFSEELEHAPYANVERIAAVLLRVRVRASSALQ
jgi:methylase of polypeptide subunit release factors